MTPDEVIDSVRGELFADMPVPASMVAKANRELAYKGGKTIVIRLGEQRVKLYPEGGTSFEIHVFGIGWCLCQDDDVNPDLEKLAEAAKAVSRATL